MAGPRFDDPVYGSNVVTGISATGNAHQTFNFNQRFEARPFFLFPYEKNDDFVPRPEISSKLGELLPNNSDDFRSAALWGLGGSGKTQIALDFAYSRYGKRQCSVFWVHADSEATFAQDYGSIASVLGTNTQCSEHELLQNARHKIESLPRWLLIIDNADDLSLFGVGSTVRNTRRIMHYIPKGPNGTILWISRDEAIVGSLVGMRRGIAVPRMTSEGSKALLESTMPRSIGADELDDAILLLKELQFLPLAISQAGAYMRRTETSVNKYLNDFKEETTRRRMLMLKEHEFDRYRLHNGSNSIIETWSPSIHHMHQENELAYKILHILAYVDKQAITEQVLEAAVSYGETKQKGDMLESKKREAIRRLKNFSVLIEHKFGDNERTYEIHKLVKDAIRHNLRNASILDGHANNTKKDSHCLGACIKRQFRNNGSCKAVRRKGEEYFASAAAAVVASAYPHKTRLKPA
ncbi:kinesin light chain [Fusarium tjaetaba]|uniref:Kinesin light chain n=1 Tax=Fusarium tjaetaba TaxID=1567544 RepID=A0A8H5RSJ2_9HYPO|nr:kinesin light chain [Fusarium tjaetaba]KAF5637341.1 kinesin light chain [Fusarium tjaetaba]